MLRISHVSFERQEKKPNGFVTFWEYGADYVLLWAPSVDFAVSCSEVLVAVVVDYRTFWEYPRELCAALSAFGRFHSEL